MLVAVIRVCLKGEDDEMKPEENDDGENGGEDAKFDKGVLAPSSCSQNFRVLVGLEYE